MNRREIFLSSAGVIVALLAWLFPFNPGPSPFRPDSAPEEESTLPGVPDSIVPNTLVPQSSPEEKPFLPVVAAGPTAVVQNVQTEHNAWQDGRFGMRIHVRFTVEGALQQPCQAVAYFFAANGTVLQDFNGAFRTGDGQVSVWVPFVPAYPSTTYNDFVLFIPYDELHMAPGSTWDLQFQVRLFHQPSGVFIGESLFVPFQFTS